jgi:hypothetical protein
MVQKSEQPFNADFLFLLCQVLFFAQRRKVAKTCMVIMVTIRKSIIYIHLNYGVITSC